MFLLKFQPRSPGSSFPYIPFYRVWVQAWIPIRREDLKMSPTYYVVHRVKFDAELEIARKAGDIAGMQRALAGLTALNRAMYGSPSNS
jgi:hypothetical protein